MFVVSEDTILHADLDSFYASVEQRDDPRLRGRPVIVGAGSCWRPATRPRPTGSAPRWAGGEPAELCPRAVVVAPRMSAYSEASKAVYRVFEDTTPLVEGMSIDEAFLDVRGLRRLSGTPTEIAVRLRRRRSASGSVCRSRSGWPEPSSSPRWRAAWPSPTACSWCRRTASWTSSTRCRSNGSGASGRSPPASSAAGDHDRRPGGTVAEAALVSMLGRAAGRHLHALAHNRDPRPVQVGRRRGSIGSQRALGRFAEIARGGRRRRRRAGRPRHPPDAAAGRVGRTVVLRLRFDDFSRATRSSPPPGDRRDRR